MLFILISLALTLSFVIERRFSKSFRKVLYCVFASILLFVLCFRYYQGTDYSSYAYLFQQVQPSLVDTIKNPPSHGEMGWHLLSVPFRYFKLPFEVFVFAIALVSMMSVLRAIQLSPYKMCSVLWMFPALYMTQMFSGLRQGLVVAVFLGYGLVLIQNKRSMRYYILILLLAQLHSCAYILLLIPTLICAWGKTNVNQFIQIGVFCGLTLICVLGYTNLLSRIGYLFGGAGVYLERSPSWSANLVRIIYGTLICYMHQANKGRCDDVTNKLFKIYVWGMVFFFLLSFSALVSNRLTLAFKCVEIILFPRELFLFRKKDGITGVRWAYDLRAKKQMLVAIVTAIIVTIPNVELYKNINAYINQGNYYEWVTPFNYPYLNVFQKDKVQKFRNIQDY